MSTFPTVQRFYIILLFSKLHFHSISIHFYIQKYLITLSYFSEIDIVNKLKFNILYFTPSILKILSELSITIIAVIIYTKTIISFDN